MDLWNNDVEYSFMDLPAFTMVNPVLAELLEFCLWVWNDVLDELTEEGLRGKLHCRDAGEKEKLPPAIEDDRDDISPERASSPQASSHMKSFAMHRQTDARQTTINLISLRPFFMYAYIGSARKCSN